MSENPPFESELPTTISQQFTNLAGRWNSIESNDRRQAIGLIYDAFMAIEGNKDLFLDMAAQTLDIPRNEVSGILNMYIRGQQANSLPTRTFTARSEASAILSGQKNTNDKDDATREKTTISDSEKIPNATIEALQNLKEQWDNIEFEQRLKMLASAYKAFAATGGFKKDFLAIAVEATQRQLTVIRLMLDTFLTHGDRLFDHPAAHSNTGKPIEDAAHTTSPQTQIATTTRDQVYDAATRFLSSPDAAIASEILDKRDLLHVAAIVGRLSVPGSAETTEPNERQKTGRKARPAGTKVISGIEELRKILGKTSYLTMTDATKLYSNIQGEWHNFSCTERAKIVKELLYYEVDWDHSCDKSIAFELFCSKISFLSRATIMGYIEASNMLYRKKIVDRRGQAETYNKLLDENAIDDIGNMRLEFDDVFGIINLDEEILIVQQTIGEGGHLTPTDLLPIRKKLEAVAIKKHSFQPGIKYAIKHTTSDEDEAAKDKYRRLVGRYTGVDDENFEFVPSTDPAYIDLASRLQHSNPHELLFNAGKGRYFFIDFRIVCPVSELEESDRQPFAVRDGFDSDEDGGDDEKEEKDDEAGDMTADREDVEEVEKQPKKAGKKKSVKKKKRK
jgi:hypothetical protein